MKTILATFALAALAACSSAYTDEELAIGQLQSGCTKDDPRVGTTAVILGEHHGVAGTLAIVDDCTLELRDFSFDGGGLDVRAIASIDGDFENGTVLTRDLRRPGGYRAERVTIPLPMGVTLDDVVHFSVWCVPANVSLGRAEL